ncbi:Membrane associated serine protease, rhomboid family [Pseudoxanthomonas sp. GM95]|uniref:rhomboid family intramembrane serine protease n=1 Tax=Pseudoxanthomonas sp. GM95 TaxID=1881043 RepID=UPI0008AB1585|nr:rhomboid family intramembrane serine protease [Pseudoxanthomonas sp. GM95]SEM46891.1 Membrane associated serine protease, rhomboid family [Pseudoxanthomonas sp. GM95]
MDAHHPDDPRFDATAQGQADRRRLLRAFNLSLGFILLLVLAYSAQGSFDWRPFAIAPHAAEGLVGILTAPLLHGSIEHIASNAIALLMLGTLAGSVYPKATVRALPVLWIGSGLGAWWLGDVGTRHLGASGLGHGLMFLVIGLGVLRRDRAAIATGFIAFLFYGGMLLTVLPREPGVSWQAHLGGAVAGLIAAWWFRRSDPLLPRKRYSWELEEEQAAPAFDDEADTLEPPSPREVPVLWDRPAATPGVVLPFPTRPASILEPDDKPQRLD